HKHLFLVCSDNAGIVAVTNKGRSRSRTTNDILKHIFMLQAQHNIRIRTEYVPSRENIADALSCDDIATFLAGFPLVAQKASFPLPEHLADKLTSV
ncbi:hypothetical protein DFH29DRAFT_819244, partial [Suillus ampliporus]